jgi:ribose transport system permease protein
VLLALIGLFSLISPNHAFFGTDNFLNIVWDSAETLLLAIGETFVIITAGIDLSVGTVLMCSGVIASWVMAETAGTAAQLANNQYPNAGLAVTLGILAGLGTGSLFGAVNGLLITRLRLPAFIVTLGTFSVANGLGDLISSAGAAGQGNIPPVPPAFANSFGSGNMLLGLPTLVFASAVAALIAHIVLTRTIFGRRTFAVGSNLEGSRLAGVPVNMHVFLVYVLCGFMAGLAGIFDLARFQTIDIASHGLDNLNAIAAVVIGGTSLFGGIGSIIGTVIGAFIPTVLRYGFTIQGVSSFWQDIVVGAIIILAVFVDQIRRQRTT